MKLTPSQSAVAVVLARLIGVICQAGMFVILANGLKAEQVGVFSVVYASWALCRMLGPIGLEELTLREISVARTLDKPAYAAAILRNACAVATAVGTLIALMAAVILTILEFRGVISLSFTEILLISGCIPVYPLIAIQAAAARAHGHIIASQVLESVSLNGLAFVLILILWLSGSLQPASVYVAVGGAAWLSAVGFVWLLWGQVQTEPEGLATEKRRQLVREGFEVWQALVLIGFTNRAPTYISLIILGSSSTAILEIALRFGTLPIIFTTGVVTTFVPLLAKSYMEKDMRSLGNDISIASWFSFLPAACALTGAVLLAPWLLDMFFPSIYQASFIPLVIYILATMVNGSFGISSSLFLLTGYQRTVRTYSIIQLAVVVVFGLVLAYFFGVAGIAAASLLGTMMFDIGLAQYMKREFGIPGFLRLDGLRNLVRSLLGGRFAWNSPQ